MNILYFYRLVIKNDLLFPKKNMFYELKTFFKDSFLVLIEPNKIDFFLNLNKPDSHIK